jgi:hypothetical protein
MQFGCRGVHVATPYGVWHQRLPPCAPGIDRQRLREGDPESQEPRFCRGDRRYCGDVWCDVTPTKSWTRHSSLADPGDTWGSHIAQRGGSVDQYARALIDSKLNAWLTALKREVHDTENLKERHDSYEGTLGFHDQRCSTTREIHRVDVDDVLVAERIADEPITHGD